jgi:hypothetical protein
MFEEVVPCRLISSEVLEKHSPIFKSSSYYTLKMKALRSSEISVTSWHTITLHKTSFFIIAAVRKNLAETVLQLLSYTDYKYALKSSAGAPKY